MSLTTYARSRISAAGRALVATAITVLGPGAALCAHFGLSWSTAYKIATLLTQGSIWLIGLYWPYLLPFLATLRGLLAVFGISAVVGW